MADSQGESWRSHSFRQKVMAQIEDAVRSAGNPTSKTSVEMENHVFQKAKTKEEYLGLVARLIIHVREINSKKDKTGQVISNQGQGVSSVPGSGIPDPINALQNLARQGPITQLTLPVSQSAQPSQLNALNMGGAQNKRGWDGLHPPNTEYLQRQLQKHVSEQQTNQSSMLTQQNLSRLDNANATHSEHFMQQQSSNQIPGNLSNVSQSMSPAQSSQMTPSPAGYLASPSSNLVPSPSSGSVRTPAGAPSPGSALNTPGNLGSVGPNASPASRNPTEDQAYLEKLKQLSKYRDPLRRMIARIDKDEDRKKDLSKMKNLLDILSDPSKRLRMDTLLKCEQVLEKLDLKEKPGDQSVGGAQLMNKHEHNLGQSLLEAVAAHIKMPNLNHTLQRTFGPAVTALHGSPVCSASPPLKKRRNEEDNADVSHVLQGEIARLEQRFRVNLNPVHHNSSRTVHLICKLDDRNLPSVPPITVTVPENYPESSPQCDTSSEEYDSTPFLQAVHKALSSQLNKMPDKFSVTALLDTWEMSVRQACSPAPSSTTQ